MGGGRSAPGEEHSAWERGPVTLSVLWGKEGKEGGTGVDRTGDERRDQGAGRREQGLPFLSSRSANEPAGGLGDGQSGGWLLLTYQVPTVS